MSRLVAIYALAEKPDGPPRYVGKTVHWLESRYRGHLSEARKGRRRPVYTWIRRLLKEGREPTLIWLENVKPHEDWQERESYWIAKFRADGVDLLNLTDGGEGQHGFPVAPLTRARISIKRRTGESKPCLTCGKKFWVKRSHIERGNGKFCSKKCKHSQQTPPAAWLAAGNAALVAKRKAMTHCKRGHPWSAENTYISRGSRLCRQCHEMRRAVYRGKCSRLVLEQAA